MADEPRSGGHRGLSMVGWVFLIGAVIFGLQIYLNPPHARPVVICWLPYQIERLVLVEAPKLFLPREPEIPLDNSLKIARWNRSCTCFMASQSLITGGKSPNLPFSCDGK